MKSEIQSTEIPSKIVGIQFSLFSPDEIEKSSWSKLQIKKHM